MRNAKKIAISAAFLLVAVGGLMIAAAAAMGNFDMENMKGLSYEMKTFEVKEPFSDIYVEDTECNVRILRATDGNCKVICSEKQDSRIYHTVTVSDGVLSVQRHDERKWYQYIGVSFGIPDVEVYLPEKEYGLLSARSTAGSIQVDDGFTFESASLESISGRVRMFSEVKKELKAETTSGSVTIENASPETLAAKSSSGRIVLSHIRSGEITARSTAGKIELTDVIAEKNLYAKSISGGVALDGCDGGTIRIETTSGSVKGTLLSDKIFITDSTSGSVKVPRSSAGGEC
ncbi:MAG: DUF4097 family beta strand repeat-containing protein [Faecousia sp.]